MEELGGRLYFFCRIRFPAEQDSGCPGKLPAGPPHPSLTENTVAAKVLVPAAVAEREGIQGAAGHSLHHSRRPGSSIDLYRGCLPAGTQAEQQENELNLSLRAPDLVPGLKAVAAPPVGRMLARLLYRQAMIQAGIISECDFKQHSGHYCTCCQVRGRFL